MSTCSRCAGLSWTSFLGAFILVGGVLLGGCGNGQGSSYDIGWLIGASSTFEATAEGMVESSLAGTAAFQTDAEGNLVGVELIHIDDSTRGISIELEPRPLEKRTYEVMAPDLMGVERSEGPAGFTAFFAANEHSFQAVRGTLRVTEASDSYVYGTFEMQMDEMPRGGSLTEGDVVVSGSFQATRPAN